MIFDIANYTGALLLILVGLLIETRDTRSFLLLRFLPLVTGVVQLVGFIR